MKARNFLVFQGDVESLACQQGPALTRLIEQVSGSDALKEESLPGGSGTCSQHEQDRKTRFDPHIRSNRPLGMP